MTYRGMFWIWYYGALVTVHCLTVQVFSEGQSSSAADGSGSNADPGDEFVLVLTKDNFEDTIAQNPHILVDFYAPRCRHCQRLAPIYAEAAKLLHTEGSSIKLGKVDAKEEQDLAKQFNIGKYPTVLLFRDGKPIEYQSVQDHSAGELVAWLKRKTGPLAEVVVSQQQIKDLSNNFDVVVAGFFKNAEAPVVKDFLKVADELDDVHFVITHSQDVFSAYNIDKDSVIILRTFDEDRVDLVGEINDRTIAEFVDLYRLPYVVEFNPTLAPIVLDNRVRKHVLYFVSKQDERFAERIETMTETAKKFKGKAIFVYVDIDNADYERILAWFFVKKEHCPATRLVDLEGLKGTLKYRPDTENWTSDELGRFVQEVLDGKRKVFLMSEEVPEDWDSELVKVLVGKSFNGIVDDPTKNVFVMFYAPWCGFCKELAPKWEALAERFKDDPDVIIAKMDATANEVDGIKVTIFPTMTFFPKGNGEATEFQNIQTTVEKLIAFVENGGIMPEEVKTDPESKSEEKQSNQKNDIKKEEL